MKQQPALSLQVIEILHYSTDVEASVAFYTGKLGWNVIWQAPGNLATLDAGGAWQLTLVSTRWAGDHEEGQPLPGPQLSLQSRNLVQDTELLTARGLPEITVNGDPAEMLFAGIPAVEGFELLAWQDNESGGATKVVDEYKAKGGHPDYYSLGECAFFVEDIAAAESFFTDMLGFSLKERHGEVYTALRIGDGPVAGLFNLPLLLKDPVFSPGGARVRLFLECHDITAEHSRQMEGGADPAEIQHSGDGLAWFNTSDPDGNQITFWQYIPPAAEDS